MKLIATILTLAAVAAGMTTASAQSISTQDAKFISSAMRANVSEIVLAQVAKTRTGDSTTQAFAQRMILDHSRNHSALLAIARKLRVDTRDQITPEAQRERDKLSRLKGRAAGREYLRFEVGDHRLVIAAFQQELATTHNSAIRNYVRTSLPVLKMHLQMAAQDAPTL